MDHDWNLRVNFWEAALEKELYEPLGEVDMAYFATYDMLDPQDAETRAFSRAPVGMPWGRTWEYGWFRGDITLDERAVGRRIVLDVQTGGEATLFVNGATFGARRADWVRPLHHYFCDQVLTQSGRPGNAYHILVEAYAGHDLPAPVAGVNCATGPVRDGDFEPRDERELRQTVRATTYGIWHEEAYQLWLDVHLLRGMLQILPEESLRRMDVEDALKKFTLTVDFEQPRDKRIADYVRAREMLKPILSARNGDTTPEMWCIGHGHIDLSWLWTYRETQRKVARTFGQQVRLMDMYPEYKYIQSQPQAYLIVKTLYPDLYRRIKEKIQSGQWIAEGGMWVEPDTNMISGESMIRQILFGKRFFKDEFGVDARLAWLPDTFGYSAVMPQLLKGCGIDYIATQKVRGSMPYNYFTWQGMDGTEITTFIHSDYNSYTDCQIVYDRWKNRVQKSGYRRFLLPFGHGDGGGGPTRDHIEHLRRQRDCEGLPKARIESPVDFFRACEKDAMPVNTFIGEMYAPFHRGTYTSQAAVKRGNRKGEVALREAEVWSAAAAPGMTYPREALDAAWKALMLNQFHDILPGSSIARVYEEAAARSELVDVTAREIIARAASSLASGAGTTWLNSLSWERRAVVDTDLGRGVVTVPAMGMTSDVDYTPPRQPVTARREGGDIILQNGLVAVRVNRLGELVACADGNGRSRISGVANVLNMYKDVPTSFDAWDINSFYDQSPVDLEGDSGIELIEDTPWRAVVRLTRSFSRSNWVQDIVLTVGKARVDFKTHVEWHEKHRLLKVVFPTGIHAQDAVNEMQFGYVKRPTHRSRPDDMRRFEVCNHRYTALCHDNRGAAVLNDCKYGVSMSGDRIELTLLRAPTCPDLHADQGAHDFTYSYFFWDGSLLDSDVTREGYELNTPLTVTSGRADTVSLMRIDAPSVVIDTVKAAEDGSGDIIIRLYESKHVNVDATLTLGFPVAHAALCDMLENEIEALRAPDGNIALHFHVFEVKTLRVRPLGCLLPSPSAV